MHVPIMSADIDGQDPVFSAVILEQSISEIESFIDLGNGMFQGPFVVALRMNKLGICMNCISWCLFRRVWCKTGHETRYSRAFIWIKGLASLTHYLHRYASSTHLLQRRYRSSLHFIYTVTLGKFYW